MKPLRHWEIAEKLRGEIGRGRFALGARLPTEVELCERFDASRHAVREALKALTDEGLISRRPRAGSLVIASQSTRSLAQRVGSVEELLNYSSETFRKTLETGFVTASDETAGVLRCAPGTPWFRIRALRYAKGSAAPLCQTDIYILPEYAGVTRHRKHAVMTVADQIAEMYGEVGESAQIDISASEIPAAVAKRLGVKAGSPALTVVRRYTDAAGRVFEVTVAVHPASRYTYSFHLAREKPRRARGR